VAAPSGGGFSFGGANVAAPSDTKTEAIKPPAAAGGFSFGGATSTAGTTTTTDEKKDASATPAPAMGGFSFGGASTTTDTTKDASATSSTPAAKSLFGAVETPAPKAPSPVKTPNDNAVTPGFASPHATTVGASSSTTTSTTPSSKPQMIEPPPIEYQSLTIEQILNRFQSELETDTISFLQEAQRISQYDATLRDTQHSLSELTNMVSRLMLHQSEVDTQLQGIGSYQRELGTTLDQLERNVDELFAAQSGISIQDADIEREKAYERALEVDYKLEQMGNVLENVVSDLNAAQERVWSSSRGEETKDEEVGKIIGVFNAHHETLAYLESKARAVEADMMMVSQVLAKSGN
jgi:nuclear pore complex protein Nup62